MIYVIADMHFWHKNIIIYESRPFKTVEQMNQVIINNWNKIIKDDDLVWILGDISLGGADKTRNIIAQLKGRKKLIKGNHDKQSKSFWLKAGFEEYFKEPVDFGNYIMSHEPIYDCDKLNICGHVHSQTHKLNPLIHKCVSVEVTDYKPVLLESLIK